jgi:hypothetical protein
VFRGEKLEDVTRHMTVEGTDFFNRIRTLMLPTHSLGVPTAKVAVEFARRCGLDLPIFFAVNAILSGDLKMEVSRSRFDSLHILFFTFFFA